MYVKQETILMTPGTGFHPQSKYLPQPESRQQYLISTVLMAGGFNIVFFKHF